MEESISIIINVMTLVFVIFIIGFSLLLGRQIAKGNSFVKKWKDSEVIDGMLENYPMLLALVEKYKQGIRIDCGTNGMKTPEKAEEYFCKSSILTAISLNPNLMQASPSLISGLGVLGTFLGLAVSVTFFDSGSSEAIMKSIKTLLGGMGTAFFTSIVGMIASSIYIWKEKQMTNMLGNKITSMCLDLDSKYYISSAELARLDMESHTDALFAEIQKVRDEYVQKNNELKDAFVQKNEDLKKSIEQKNDELKNVCEQKSDELKGIFMCKDDEGFLVKPGNLLQDLYEESTKQTQSLSSFTTDLSNQLNSSLVKSMDTSIVPLIKNIELTHSQLIAKMNTLGENLHNPATDLVGNVVKELKSSMGELVSEFKQGITEEASVKIDFLANRLAETGEILNAVPKAMEEMSNQMTSRFSDIQAIVQNLQSSAARISEETMTNMRGQMNDATKTLSTAVVGLQEQQQAIIEQNRQANEIAIERMKLQFDEIMVSFKGLAEKVESQHEDMIGRQITSVKEVERMLNSFNSSIELLRKSNNETGLTLAKLTDVSTAIDSSSSNLTTLASTMASTAEDLAKQQDERINEFKRIQDSNQKLIEEVNASTEKARELMKTYTGEYPVIKEGLVDIFNKISEGLQEYSKTLRTSTSDALSEYASALEISTKALQNIAVNLNDTAEELTEGIENFKNSIR